MFRIERRRLLSMLAGLPAAWAVSPALAMRGPVRPEAPAGEGPGLVDAHCHVFNVTDLAATKFILVSFLEKYPRERGMTLKERILESKIRQTIGRISLGVPSAAEEAKALGASLFAPPSVPDLTPAQNARIEQDRQEAGAAARDVERESGAVVQPRRREKGPPGRCRPRKGSGLSSSLRAGVRWVKLIRKTRSELVRVLAARHKQAGYRPTLLCPALVDYSNWLGEALRSPLPDQVSVMGRIASRSDLPPVHGYAPFDPLRQAMFDRRIVGIDGGWDPMALLRKALTQEGFAGVKLYPPMGFKPIGNAADADAGYPPKIAGKLGGNSNVGAALDEALDRFWDFCEAGDVPVMAHASNGNAAGRYYGFRADPVHWVELLEKRRSLRIMLAHFGSFQSASLGHGVPGEKCPRRLSFEDSWEGVIGRYVRRRPDSNLYADISFLAEVYGERGRLRSAERLREYLQFDPGGRHLIFGSDWVMLGIHKKWGKPPAYAAQVAAFLRDCGLTGEEVEGVMEKNALRFLGLRRREATRERLLSFYSVHGLPPERLPLAV
jgi:predicted TIM-barrel fold metal-dependent hydrolase